MYGGKVLDTILHIYKLVVVQSNVSLKEAEELSPGTVLDLKDYVPKCNLLPRKAT